MSEPRAAGKNPAGARFARWLTIAVVSLALPLVLSGGASALLAQGPRQLLDDWDEQGHIGDEESWRRAVGLLEWARRLNPLDAEIPLALGRFHHWRAVSLGMLDEGRHAALTRAGSYYRQALRLRPQWPLAWMYLGDALVLDRRLRDGGLDALRKVIEKDPYGTHATQRALELLALAWPLLEAEDRCRFGAVVAYRDAWPKAWRSLGDEARQRVVGRLPRGALDEERLAGLRDWIIARREAYVQASFLERFVIGLRPRPRDLARRYCGTTEASDATTP